MYQQALLTKKKWEDIVQNNIPFPCKQCKKKKLPSEFVMHYLDNQLVGKYRYLYECKQCKRDRIYKGRDLLKTTIEWAMEVVHRQLYQWAKKRGLEFCVTYDDLLALRNKQQGRCYYSGYEMTYEFVGYKQNSNWTEKAKTQLSCDRIDNTKWYILNNVVLCCTFVNHMKWSLPVEEFYRVCQDIVKKWWAHR